MTESTDRELLPCPFCGCNDGRIELQTDHAIFAGMDFGNRYPEPISRQPHGHNVRCGGCGCQTCWWHYKREAIDAWNRRSAAAAMAEGGEHG
ncbi:MAG TPA: hypothetical protein DD710_10345 [Alcanivorax sp.]|nr:hypothetical protein [Alcanivorax sp.]MBF47420.1 hypothetical protein [Alcanivorax sp.]MBF47759.1 hypothetical protein [Alcanivorax sp.]HBP92925.1 hypothetical protein [Alcanivorax sp.]|tara:strand:- start:113 stop:388 length:276 start_codon:yes stop_codon:yes gene_type:complete